jgi:hypothetical protein
MKNVIKISFFLFALVLSSQCLAQNPRSLGSTPFNQFRIYQSYINPSFMGQFQGLEANFGAQVHMRKGWENIKTGYFNGSATIASSRSVYFVAGANIYYDKEGDYLNNYDLKAMLNAHIQLSDEWRLSVGTSFGNLSTTNFVGRNLPTQTGILNMDMGLSIYKQKRNEDYRNRGFEDAFSLGVSINRVLSNENSDFENRIYKSQVSIYNNLFIRMTNPKEIKDYLRIQSSYRFFVEDMETSEARLGADFFLGNISFGGLIYSRLLLETPYLGTAFSVGFRGIQLSESKMEIGLSYFLPTSKQTIAIHTVELGVRFFQEKKEVKSSKRKKYKKRYK